MARRGIRSKFALLLGLALPFIWAYTCFFALQVMSHTSMPLSVVISDSMVPALQRGDLILSEGWSAPAVDDIVLYRFGAMENTVVHRVIDDDGGLLTKGDANRPDDRRIYDAAEPGRRRLRPEDVHGTVYFRLPFLGFLNIWFREYYFLFVPLLALWVWREARAGTE